MSSQTVSANLPGALALAPRQAAIHLRLIARASRYRMGLFLTAVGLVGSTVMVVVTPMLVGWAIDSGLGVDTATSTVDGNMGTLLLAGLLLMLAAVARSAFVYLQTYVGER